MKLNHQKFEINFKNQCLTISLNTLKTVHSVIGTLFDVLFSAFVPITMIVVVLRQFVSTCFEQNQCFFNSSQSPGFLHPAILLISVTMLISLCLWWIKNIFNPYLNYDLFKLLGKEVIEITNEQFLVKRIYLRNTNFGIPRTYLLQNIRNLHLHFLFDEEPINLEISFPFSIPDRYDRKNAYCLGFVDSGITKVCFAYNLELGEANQILKAIYTHFPNLSRQWETRKPELFVLYDKLISFALVSRWQEISFEEIISLSGIPKEIIKRVYDENPWLNPHIYAIARGRPKPSSMPTSETYILHLNFIWDYISSQEKSISFKISKIFKSLRKSS